MRIDENKLDDIGMIRIEKFGYPDVSNIIQGLLRNHYDVAITINDDKEFIITYASIDSIHELKWVNANLLGKGC